MWNPVEIIGYVASAFVAGSLVMSSILALRIINLIGAIVFVVYGILIGSLPIILTNGFITMIDIYYLVQMARASSVGVRYLSIGPAERGRVDEFVDHHRADIVRHFPDFTDDLIDEGFRRGGDILVAIHDLRIEGFAIVHPVPQDDASARSTADVQMASGVDAAVWARVREIALGEPAQVVRTDYVTRRYRGLGLNGRLLTRIAERSGGDVPVIALVAESAPTHSRFLKSVGFGSRGSASGFEILARDVRAPGGA